MSEDLVYYLHLIYIKVYSFKSHENVRIRIFSILKIYCIFKKNNGLFFLKSASLQN